MEKCCICNKEFKHIITHILKCGRINNKDIDTLKVYYYKLKFGSIVSKKNLEHYYIEKLYSLPDFKKEFNLSYKITQYLLKYYKIPIRNIKESINLEKTLGRRKKTLLKIYGVENASKSEIIKEKKRKTFLKNYGVDNIWKRRDYYVWMNEYMLSTYGKKRNSNGKKISDSKKLFSDEKWEEIKNKSEKTSIKNYGVPYYSKTDKSREYMSKKAKERWLCLTDEQKNNIINKLLSKNPSYVSNLENRVAAILTKNNIQFSTQKFVGGKSFDFMIGNILLEVNGDFWHANPLKYKDEDILNHPMNEMSAKEIWKRDIRKKEMANKYGFNVIYLWENEINKLNDDELIILIEKRIIDVSN